MNTVLRTLRAPAIAAASIHGVAGACFILANLVMAWSLPLEEFGVASLIIALGNIGISGGPAALNGVVLRYDLRADWHLVVHGAAAVALTALLLTLVASRGYGLDPIAVAVIAAAVLTGGIAVLAQASLKRAHQFVRASLLGQVGNVTLLAAALVMAAGVARFAWFPMLAVAAAFAASAWFSWSWLRGQERDGAPMRAGMWPDALRFAGLALSWEVLIQMERLLIPLMLSLTDLALFAVVAAVAIAPFRMLELGVGMTLTARLGRLESLRERRALLAREGRMLLLFCGLGAGSILLLGKPTIALVLDRPDSVSWALLAAAVCSGLARVGSSLAHGIAAAYCVSRELRLVNLGSWLALAIGAAAGLLLAPLGLVGVVYGVSLGWLARGLFAFAVARRHVLA